MSSYGLDKLNQLTFHLPGSTPDCNFHPDWSHSMQCVNGISIDYGNSHVVRGVSSLCEGSCANFSASVGGIELSIFTCDPYNLCKLPDHGVNLTSSCCTTDNCNIADITQLEKPTPTNRSITCFEGIDIGRNGAVGFHVNCSGQCARAHLGDDTFYTCDGGKFLDFL